MTDYTHSHAPSSVIPPSTINSYTAQSNTTANSTLGYTYPFISPVVNHDTSLSNDTHRFPYPSYTIFNSVDDESGINNSENDSSVLTL